jgi:predicted nucleic acid-binding protein
MTSQICVDASIVIPLVVYEDLSGPVRERWVDWRTRNLTIVAPFLLGFEITAVLRKKVYRGLLTPHEGMLAFRAAHEQGIQLLHPPDIHQRAWDLSIRFNRPTAYDSYYLALADSLGCEFWTGDERLYRAVGDHLPWVRCAAAG